MENRPNLWIDTLEVRTSKIQGTHVSVNQAAYCSLKISLKKWFGSMTREGGMRRLRLSGSLGRTHSQPATPLLPCMHCPATPGLPCTLQESPYTALPCTRVPGTASEHKHYPCNALQSRACTSTTQLLQNTAQGFASCVN